MSVCIVTKHIFDAATNKADWCLAHDSEYCIKYPGCLVARRLEDGRMATAYATAFGSRILVSKPLLNEDPDITGGYLEYMYNGLTEAYHAVQEWDSYGDAPGKWIRKTEDVGNKNVVTRRLWFDGDHYSETVQ